MAFTLAQRTALEKAIAAGTRRVRYADGETEYRSLAEMQQLLKQMDTELNAGTINAHAQPRHQLADFADD